MGCGTLSPECVEGLNILDLGSGNGRDSFMFSRLVGERGKVIGVDLASNQVCIISEAIFDLLKNMKARMR